MNRGEKAAMTRLRNERNKLHAQKRLAEQEVEKIKERTEKEIKDLQVNLSQQHAEVNRLFTSRKKDVEAQASLEEALQILRDLIILCFNPALGSVDLGKTKITAAFPEPKEWAYTQPTYLEEGGFRTDPL